MEYYENNFLSKPNNNHLLGNTFFAELQSIVVPNTVRWLQRGVLYHKSNMKILGGLWRGCYSLVLVRNLCLVQNSRFNGNTL